MIKFKTSLVKKTQLFLLSLATAFILFTSCSDDPSTVGFSLIYDTLDIIPVTSSDLPLITGAGNYYKFEPMINLPYIMVGKAPNLDDKLVSAAIIRFKSFPVLIGKNLDSLKVITGPDRIVSVKFYLYPAKYVIGDTINNHLEFSILKVKNIWDNTSKFIDLFPGEDITTSPNIDYSTEYASYSGNISYKDSLINPLTFEMKKDEMATLVYEWIQKQKRLENFLAGGGKVDSLNIPDSIANWGMALVPKGNSNVIRQFYGVGNSDTSYKAHFWITFLNSKNELDSFRLVTALEGTFMNAGEPDLNTITIQGVRTIRGEMKFDLSAIPEFSSIHKAQLELTLNSAKSYFGSQLPDSILYAVTYTEGRTGYIQTENYANRVSGTDKFLFTQFIQPCELWTNRKGTGTINFVAQGKTVYLKPDRFVFYGIDEADTTKKPRLRLIYSRKPDYRKGGND